MSRSLGSFYRIYFSPYSVISADRSGTSARTGSPCSGDCEHARLRETEPIMMTVTPTQTARHLQQRARTSAAAGEERARHLRARLPALVRCLRQDYGVDQVILFGSVANQSCSPSSDLDLAVSGLSRRDYFKALADLMALLEGPLDLVRLEEAPPSLRERIAAEGKPL